MGLPNPDTYADTENAAPAPVSNETPAPQDGMLARIKASPELSKAIQADVRRRLSCPLAYLQSVLVSTIKLLETELNALCAIADGHPVLEESATNERKARLIGNIAELSCALDDSQSDITLEATRTLLSDFDELLSEALQDQASN